MTTEEANAACAAILAPIHRFADSDGYKSFAARVVEARGDVFRFTVPMTEDQVAAMVEADIAADRRVMVEFLVDYGGVAAGERRMAYQTEAVLMAQQGVCRPCTEP